MTEWLIHEFQNRTEVRIGANPKLIPASIWKTWEDDLGNVSFFINITSNIFLSNETIYVKNNVRLLYLENLLIIEFQLSPSKFRKGFEYHDESK